MKSLKLFLIGAALLATGPVFAHSVVYPAPEVSVVYSTYSTRHVDDDRWHDARHYDDYPAYRVEYHRGYSYHPGRGHAWGHRKHAHRHYRGCQHWHDGRWHH